MIVHSFFVIEAKCHGFVCGTFDFWGFSYFEESYKNNHQVMSYYFHVHDTGVELRINPLDIWECRVDMMMQRHGTSFLAKLNLLTDCEPSASEGSLGQY